MSHPTRFGRPVLLAFAALSLAPAAASACVSTPTTANVADSSVDAQSGVAPEATAIGVTLDATCRATFSYSVINQNVLLSGDSLIWFVDTDGSIATGSQTGYAGADIGLVRSSNGSTLLSRYNPATAGWTPSAITVTLEGQFSVSVDLSAVVPLGTAPMTLAGGTVWKNASSGISYYDFVPEPGVSPVPFTAALFADPVPTPAPVAPVAPVVVAPVIAPVTPAVPAVTAKPTPAVTPAPQTDDDTASCEVPTVRGLTLTVAKARIRHAGCKVGTIKKKTSKVIKSGRVIQANEYPGDFVDLGTKLNLVISTGKPKSKAKAARLDEPTTSSASALATLVDAASARG